MMAADRRQNEREIIAYVFILYAFYVPLVGCNNKQYKLHGTNILE